MYVCIILLFFSTICRTDGNKTAKLSDDLRSYDIVELSHAPSIFHFSHAYTDCDGGECVIGRSEHGFVRVCST